MNFAIISVGTELNLGLILNTNTKYIAEILTELGFECNFMVTVRDNEPDIIRAIKICTDSSDFVIISGGLGPTEDDITREAVAKAQGLRLKKDNSLDESSLRFLKYIKNDGVIHELLKQSFIPEGSTPIKPRVGSASGFLVKTRDNKIIFSIPGVPREMKDMFDHDVIPFLKKHFVDKKHASESSGKIDSGGKRDILKKVVLLTTDISESQTEFMLKDIKKAAMERKVDIGITANPGLIKLILIARSEDTAECDRNLKFIENEIESVLKENIYGKDGSTIGDSIKAAIIESGKKFTISTAESITGGLVSSLITDTPGSSKYFKGSIISYTDYVKKDILGLSGDVIKSDGAVSKNVCLEMAKKSRLMFKTDFAISTTGIAGPTSPVKGKDIGLVYCSIVGPDLLEETYEKKFIGTRSDIKFRTAQFVLNRLRLAIINKRNRSGV